jgi:tetratricopeptide (TPR) repeat protein
LAAPAAAQDQDLHPYSVLCTGAGPETSIDRRIAACDTIMNSGRFQEAGLPFLYYQRALRYTEKGDMVRALADLNESLRRKPDDADVVFTRANLYHDRGDLAHALEDYNAAIRLAPAAALPHAYRGDLYMKQNDLAHAFDDFDAAIQLDANEFEAYFGRGQLYAGQKDFARAIADFDQAIRIKPDNAQGYRWRAYAYSSSSPSDYPRAISDYNAALRITPNDTDVIQNRASSYDATGDRVRGLADWRRLTALDSRSLDAWNGTCWDMALLNLDLAQARTACDTALAIKRDSNVLDSRGFVGLKQGRFQDAWNDYDAAARTDPSRATYFYGRGIAALRLNRTAEGQADVAHALQLDPGIAATYAGYGMNP